MITRGVPGAPPSAARNFPGISVATSMPVKPPPMTSAVHCPGDGTRAGQRRDMGVEPATGVIGVDVEGVSVEAGDRRARETAAEGENQPVIRQG